VTPGVALIQAIVILGALGLPWLVALDDVLRRTDSEFPQRSPDTSDRTIWILVVLLGNIIGAVFYYAMVMGPYPRQRG
jgi:multisubunit Na+/H+ antiporter MnhB subunit